MKAKPRPKVLVVDDDRALRHGVGKLLQAEGVAVSTAADGLEALEKAHKETFDLLLLDIGLPGLNGLEVLGRVAALRSAPKVVMMTSDDTPETILRAVREKAYAYLTKPMSPKEMVELIRSAIAAPALPPIEVVSARPEWVELLVPCSLEAVDRIQSFMKGMEARLADDVRDSVGTAFRELLMNAVEWGGKLDPTRRVRIAYVRTKRMLLYRIADPGPGFHPEALSHAAVTHPDNPLGHAQIREDMGLRPGGFGLLLVRSMVDELVYNEAHNEVLFVKYLDPAASATG
jgi:CheY-like chemotaxis protein/anti-sigma regulatory factor (Ser/Thr protein kinase)